jgi:uncharacterized protein YndB with AHSA1/START domain
MMQLSSAILRARSRSGSFVLTFSIGEWCRMQPMASTRVRQTIDAPRERVYEALVDRDAVARWRVPEGMSCEVHEFEAREGGTIRVSLTYDAPDREGKTAGRTDTYRGRFLALVPGELVVEEDEFETSDPALRGVMTMTFRLADADGGGGTELLAEHEGLPAGLSPEQNEIGFRESLARLAALVEGRQKP